MDKAQIERNIRTRHSVDEAFEFCQSEEHLDIDKHKFWNELALKICDKINCKLIESASIRVMDYEEAIKFEQSYVPFGIHQGRKVHDIDPKYWTIITETPFNLQLRRYLLSRRFQEIQESED